MFGRLARPCLNLHGMYRRFGVVHLVSFCLPTFLPFFVIFRAFLWDFRGDVLEAFSCEIPFGCHV
jgi:hypothetical protein